MNKLLIVLVFITVNCIFISAQDEKENFVGFKGGVSIPQLSSNQSNELSRDYKSRVAPNFGGFVSIGLSKKFSFQTEVNYAGQGGKRIGVQPISQPPPGLPLLPNGVYYYGNFRNVAKLNYLEIPAMLKYRFGAKDKPRVYLNGGFYYGRLLNAKQVTSGSSTIFLDKDGRVPLLLPPAGTALPPIPFDAETDIKRDLNQNNFGLTGGGGIEFPQGNNRFLIDARVSYGLRSIQKDTVRNGDSKTGSLVISFGYAFGWKK
ncbi:MAG: porin family protein [Acidobacteriota bacterium]